MKTITPAQHAAIVARAYMKNPRSAMFTRMGETQESACKRILSASKRAGKSACSRDFPAYKPGMSTKEYVRAYENVNSGKGLKTGFYELADLNCKPAALYEGGLIDYAPTVEECEPMPIEAAAAAVCADVAPAAPAAAVPTADVVRPAAPEAAEPVPLDWQTLAARPTAIYATPVRKIGVHEWRTVVYAHGTYGACTDHVWRRVDQNRGAFKMARDWPTYDSDRTHSGLPLTLGKLYAEHEEAIKAALNSLRLADPAPAAAPAAEPAAAPLEFVSRYTGPRCNGMSALSAKIECAKRAKDEPDFSFVVAECKGEGLPAYQVAALRGKYEVQRWRRAAPAAAPLPCPAPCPAAPPAPASRSAPVAPIEGYSTSPDHSEHPLDVSARKLAELRAEMADEPLAGHRSDGFLQYVIGAREADHARLESAFAAFAAVGDGTEMVNKDGRRYCIMLPDASQPGKYRWQGFDERGFFTHSTHSTAEDAVADAASQGYYTAAPGALDRLASLPAWARGMAINEVMQEHSSGRMPWADACDRMQAIHAKHDALEAAAAADAADAAPAPAAAPACPSDTVAPIQMPSGACSTSSGPADAPVRLPHRQAAGASLAHQGDRPAIFRQRKDSIRLASRQQRRVPILRAILAEHRPVCADHFALSAAQSSPAGGKRIRAFLATVDDKLDRPKRIRSIERAKGSSLVFKVPAAAHQQPVSLGLHSLLFGEQRPAILGKAGLHMSCFSEPHMTRQPFDVPALSSPPAAAASTSPSQSRRLSWAAAVIPPAQCSHRKGESPQAIGPSVPGSGDPRGLRMNPRAGFLEHIGPRLPGCDELTISTVSKTRNSQAHVRPQTIRRAHGPPADQAL